MLCSSFFSNWSKKNIKILSYGEFVCDGWSFMSGDDGERRYLYFSLNIWFHEFHPKELYFVQNISYNELVHQLLIDLSLAIPFFDSFFV